MANTLPCNITKETILLQANTFPSLKISHKCVCGRGSALDPLGELTAVLRPLVESGEGRKGRKKKWRTE